MEEFEDALRAELNQDYREAIRIYEEVLNSTKARTVEFYANLSFIYWYFGNGFDFGVSDDPLDPFSFMGVDRDKAILEKGLEELPNDLELHFWKRYFAHILLGEEMTQSDVEKLLREFSDDSLVPYFFLVQYDKEKYEKKADELIKECYSLPIAKNLYILSVLKQPVPEGYKMI